MKRLFFVLLILGILLRLFYGFGVPDNAFTDNLHHLKNTRAIMQAPGKLLELPGPTFPLYYALNAIALTIFGLSWPGTRVFPFLLQLAQLILSFLLFKQFSRDRLAIGAGMAFVLFHPMLIRYGGLNYTGTLTSVFLLATALFLTKNKNKESLTFACLACLTKLSGFLALPGLLLTDFKKNIKHAWILLLPLIYLFFTRSPDTLTRFFKQIMRILSPAWFLFYKPEYLLLLPWTFWGLPHFKWPLLNMAGVVSWFVLAPILLVVVFGFFELKKRNARFYWFLLISSAFFVLACLHTYGDARYMIPLIPLLGVPLVLGCEKRPPWASMVFFVVYSIVLTLGTLILYWSGY